MKRILINLVLVFVCFSCLYADNTEISKHLEDAQNYYNSNNFEDAIREYEILILDGFINPYVYYNLSNSYYKNNEFGKAVLNLERALKIMPRNKDFQKNKNIFLSISNEPKKNIAEYYLYKLLLLFSLNEIVSVTVIFLILLLILVSVYLIKMNRKFIVFIIVLSIINVLDFSLLSLKFYDEIILDKYIVLQNAPVRNSPSKDEEIAFEINEGRQVVVLGEVGRWVNIKLSVDGLTGWVDKNLIEKI